MAKKKEPKPLKDCKACVFSMERDELYCRLRLQDENVLKESGIVSKQDCIWFKERTK